jgi:hypothetical protein
MKPYERWYKKNHEEVKAKKRESMRLLRAKNPEKYAKHSRDAKVKIRRSVLDAFGRSCAICGFSDERALTLDHILNNGASERKELGERVVYYRALKLEYKSEYRILCMNCQFIERHKAGRQNQYSAAVVRLAWELLT